MALAAATSRAGVTEPRSPCVLEWMPAWSSTALAMLGINAAWVNRSNTMVAAAQPGRGHWGTRDQDHCGGGDR